MDDIVAFARKRLMTELVFQRIPVSPSSRSLSDGRIDAYIAVLERMGAPLPTDADVDAHAAELEG